MSKQFLWIFIIVLMDTLTMDFDRRSEIGMNDAQKPKQNTVVAVVIVNLLELYIFAFSLSASMCVCVSFHIHFGMYIVHT